MRTPPARRLLPAALASELGRRARAVIPGGAKRRDANPAARPAAPAVVPAPLHGAGATAGDAGPAADAGLTLVELLVVLVILGLIATIGGIQVVNYLGRAKADTAKLQLEDIRSAIDLFRIDVGRPPSEAEGLAVLVDPPAAVPGWRGPYLRKRATLTDPWGRAWIYKGAAAAPSFEIVSLGADGKPGGEGDDRDITSADRP